MTDRLIRITPALAVATVAAVAAIIGYRHAYELVSTYGESGLTARLVPFTVDGLILAASLLILDASRRNQPVPPLARWCLGARARALRRSRPLSWAILCQSQRPVRRTGRAWSRRYELGTTRATVSGRSPASSTSTAAKSIASSRWAPSIGIAYAGLPSDHAQAKN